MTQAVEIVLQLYRAMSKEEKTMLMDEIAKEAIASLTGWSSTGAATMPPTALGAVTVNPAIVSEKLVEARFAAFSPISWCRKVDKYNPLEKGAYAIEGPWVKAKDMLHEGELIFFGFKKPHIGYALLSVEDGASVTLTASVTGATVTLHNVMLLKQADSVGEIAEKLKEFYL